MRLLGDHHYRLDALEMSSYRSAGRLHVEETSSEGDPRPCVIALE